ncbi:MAG: hypothetical protein QUS12_10210 [Methanosarcina sp.]|jgi:hypothetical protein|nr:hypothetical protein [Methanosarcina sp.]
MNSIDPVIRWGWLKFMYLYTIIGAGLLGLGVVIAPESIITMMGWPLQDPVIFGVFGSVFVAFGLVSLFGLRSPLKFVPVLLLQLSYKIIWFAGVALPLILKGQFPAHGYVFAVIFLSYIIGDFIAIPFGYLSGKGEAGKNIATT